MFSRHLKPVVIAFHETFADSGFSMAGAVAYSFVLSLFPFCIFLAALAGYFGGEALAQAAVQQLFQLAPAPVVEAIAPEVMRVMGQSRFGLLTVGALIALFFATSAVESCARPSTSPIASRRSAPTCGAWRKAHCSSFSARWACSRLPGAWWWGRKWRPA
jgi:membrane protein